MQRVEQDRSAADRFLSTTASRLSNLLKHGAVVDDDFVDMLLGQAPSSTVRCAAQPRNRTSPFMGGKSLVSQGPRLAKDKAVSWADPDALHLSGLLNVLDGVVDSPGRIVVMTTNHVDHLDPALIRPGRIDLQLLLGYMDGPNAVSMLEHYYQTSLTESQRARTHLAMDQNDLTPAQLEQMTAVHAHVDDLLAVLLGNRVAHSDGGNSTSTTTTTESLVL